MLLCMRNEISRWNGSFEQIKYSTLHSTIYNISWNVIGTNPRDCSTIITAFEWYFRKFPTFAQNSFDPSNFPGKTQPRKIFRNSVHNLVELGRTSCRKFRCPSCSPNSATHIIADAMLVTFKCSSRLKIPGNLFSGLNFGAETSQWKTVHSSETFARGPREIRPANSGKSALFQGTKCCKGLCMISIIAEKCIARRREMFYAKRFVCGGSTLVLNAAT